MSENQIVTQFLDSLSQIKDAEEDVVVVGATNRPDVIDDAIGRTGQMSSTTLSVEPAASTITSRYPGAEARVAIFEAYLGSPDHDIEDPTAGLDLDWLAKQTDSWVASAMEKLAEETVNEAVNCHGHGGRWLVSGLTASYPKGFRAFTGPHP